MDKPTLIFKDERPIKTILWPGQEESHFTVGVSGVEKIVPYFEASTGDPIWFAIYANGELTHRVNMKYIDTVMY